jgi:hypothetical protein
VGFPFGEDTGLLRGFCSFSDASAQQRRGLIEEFKSLRRQFIMMNDWFGPDFRGKLREDRAFLCHWFFGATFYDRWFFGCWAVRVCCHICNLEQRMPGRYK